MERTTQILLILALSTWSLFPVALILLQITRLRMRRAAVKALVVMSLAAVVLLTRSGNGRSSP